MKWKNLTTAIFCFLLFGCIASFLLYRQPPAQNDAIAINQIVKEAAAHFPNLSQWKETEAKYPFSIISPDGTTLFQSAPDTITSAAEAMARGDAVIDLELEGRLCGKVIIMTGLREQSMKAQTTAALMVLAFAVISAFSAALYLFYLYRRILKPFHKMKEFAAQVSLGNLDFPLVIEKNNLFGAFTESFDRMREQLLLSRKRELQASQNQKELVASLSHDIKTPVTSIKITSELLLELIAEQKLKDKIGTIYHKAEQIDQLVTNLFHTTLQDMEQLTVTPVEIYSRRIITILREADYYDKVMIPSIPDCMLFVDELSLTQIISNILQNSYKYANTPIHGEACLLDAHLKLVLRDEGSGVCEDELPLLCNKFYRGKNAAAKSGSGIGLYISKKLILQMKGDMYCSITPEGFAVTLLIALR